MIPGLAIVSAAQDAVAQRRVAAGHVEGALCIRLIDLRRAMRVLVVVNLDPTGAAVGRAPGAVLAAGFLSEPQPGGTGGGGVARVDEEDFARPAVLHHAARHGSVAPGLA